MWTIKTGSWLIWPPSVYGPTLSECDRPSYGGNGPYGLDVDGVASCRGWGGGVVGARGRWRSPDDVSVWRALAPRRGGAMHFRAIRRRARPRSAGNAISRRFSREIWQLVHCSRRRRSRVVTSMDDRRLLIGGEDGRLGPGMRGKECWYHASLTAVWPAIKVVIGSKIGGGCYTMHMLQ